VGRLHVIWELLLKVDTFDTAHSRFLSSWRGGPGGHSKAKLLKVHSKVEKYSSLDKIDT
jgi:hypothetical protein